MSVNDLSDRIRRRPPRVRWLLLSFVSFTLGVAAAATLFAYTSRIPIPLKENPTRSAGPQLDLRASQNQPKTEAIEPEIKFRETLRRRSEGLLPESQTEAPPPVQQNTAYYLIAGAFENESLAGERRELIAAGLEDQQVQVRIKAAADSDRRIHRVLVGPFASSEDVDRMRGRLALIGLESRIEKLPSAPPVRRQQVAQ